MRNVRLTRVRVVRSLNVRLLWRLLRLWLLLLLLLPGGLLLPHHMAAALADGDARGGMVISFPSVHPGDGRAAAQVTRNSSHSPTPA
jgi:hypothetical protein